MTRIPRPWQGPNVDPYDDRGVSMSLDSGWPMQMLFELDMRLQQQVAEQRERD